LNSPFGEKWLREDLVAHTRHTTSLDEDELMTGVPTSSTRSQRLTKTQPDPVRAYEAVTTDELSIRGQRPTRAQHNPVRAQGQQLRMNSPYAVKDRRGHSLIPYEPKGSNYG